jgi:2-dehydropantoate 2-reductase
MNEVAVLGVGGVGGCVAAVLAQRGVRVTCIGRRATVEALQTQGLHLDSRAFGRFTVWPAAAERLDYPVDVLIVATKATALPSALDAIDASLVTDAVVIPLLNGLEHVPQIRARLGARVAPGSIRIEARTTAPGHVEHTSPFAIITIASDRDVPPTRLAAIADFLSGCGLDTRVGASEAEVLWEKLARLAALACTTALSNQPIGVIRSDAYWRALLTGAVHDCVAVATACGVPMTVETQMEVIDGLPATLTTSMQRDIVAHRPSELDAIAGAVVRAGRAYGLACPTLEELIRRIETERVHAVVDGRRA